jgi:hypothetical protein
MRFSVISSAVFFAILAGPSAARAETCDPTVRACADQTQDAAESRSKPSERVDAEILLGGSKSIGYGTTPSIGAKFQAQYDRVTPDWRGEGDTTSRWRGAVGIVGGEGAPTRPEALVRWDGSTRGNHHLGFAGGFRFLQMTPISFRATALPSIGPTVYWGAQSPTRGNATLVIHPYFHLAETPNGKELAGWGGSSSAELNLRQALGSHVDLEAVGEAAWTYSESTALLSAGGAITVRPGGTGETTVIRAEAVAERSLAPKDANNERMVSGGSLQLSLGAGW